MSNKLVSVYTVAGHGPAEVIRGVLEAAGIPAEISQESAGMVYGFTVGGLGLAHILVAAEHEAEARALLEAMRRGDLMSDDELDETSGEDENPKPQ